MKNKNATNRERTAAIRSTAGLDESEREKLVDAIIARKKKDGFSREEFIEESFGFLAWRICELEKRIEKLER